MVGLVLAPTVAAMPVTSAAERASSGGAQGPNLSQDEPQWPNLRLDDIDAPKVNKHPSFVDPQEVEDRIMGRKAGAAVKPGAPAKQPSAPNSESANGLDANASDARWPSLRLDDIEAPRASKHPSFT